ncbi:hypothetical protein ACIO6U_02665 [Streptomyces sp. NPDC087422]|uniref:hypothetical protein n=1 Tax=Streptomyces sp. NPDC087422 TaxID=3365786 RepID=UPI00381B208D
MTTDPLAYLRDALDKRQKIAEMAMSACWHTDYCDEDGEPFHAANDPAAVLRRIAADRKLLELHAAVPDHGRFSERTCEESGCDGDHSAPPVCRTCRTHAGDPTEAPCQTVEILAEAWGWTAN